MPIGAVATAESSMAEYCRNRSDAGVSVRIRGQAGCYARHGPSVTFQAFTMLRRYVGVTANPLSSR
jgi:hypothetical protein